MWSNIGEDLKCYIDRMCEQPEFKFLTEFCLPIKRTASISAVTSFDAYLRSIGKGEEEREKWVDDEDEEWKEKVMSHTKRELRNMFSTFYRSRDLDRLKGNRKKHSWEWLKLNIPDINVNIDWSSLRWWQRWRIKFGERPFNKYDQYCTDGALGTLDQKASEKTLNSNNKEEEGFSRSSYDIVDGSQLPYTDYVLPQLCPDENIDNENKRKEASQIIYDESLEYTGYYTPFTSNNGVVEIPAASTFGFTTSITTASDNDGTDNQQIDEEDNPVIADTEINP